MSCAEIIRKIKRGTAFVERAQGIEYPMIATMKPRVVRFDDKRRKAVWRGRGGDGRIVEYCITEA
jgi:hypothetical protein